MCYFSTEYVLKGSSIQLCQDVVLTYLSLLIHSWHNLWRCVENVTFVFSGFSLRASVSHLNSDSIYVYMRKWCGLATEVRGVWEIGFHICDQNEKIPWQIQHVLQLYFENSILTIFLIFLLKKSYCIRHNKLCVIQIIMFVHCNALTALTFPSAFVLQTCLIN